MVLPGNKKSSKVTCFSVRVRVAEERPPIRVKAIAKMHSGSF
jgi:hypothetical protein